MGTEVGDYDPFARPTLEDPATAHAWLREHCPVHRYDRFDPPFYTLSRHEDVLEGLRDIETWSSEFGQGPQVSKQGGMLDDPPGHTMFRRMTLSAFTPKVVDRMAPTVEALAHELIDEMTAGGATAGDLHEGIACPLPVITIARMLGVAEEDRVDFKAWSDASVAGMNGDVEARDWARRHLNAYFLAEMKRRRDLLAAGDEPPDDLTTGLVKAAAEAPRPIEDSELLGVLSQLLIGGNETTTSLITNAVWRLCEVPERWAALVADPSLVDVAIEESLRFDSPVLGLFRMNTCPVTLHGVEIPKDSKVHMMYASANRDPAVWEDPDEFRLDRDLGDLRRRHLAFGTGVHFCLGAPLARLEARAALTALAQRLPKLRLDGPMERIAPFLLFGKHTQPVRWD